MYRRLSVLLSFVLIGLGVAMVVVTLANGGGVLGVILGPMFVAAGAGRFYVTRARG